jgi:hypothetical protein
LLSAAALSGKIDFPDELVEARFVWFAVYR